MVNEIEAKRKDLIDTARLYGLNAKATIACSQELDELLLKEIKLQSKYSAPPQNQKAR
ncbi:aspartyl-phosphate phosphatase Spo0E family protein [Metabacillus sp. GX 13764]|uniref:aspartyl-phosphate phosphatase Spo0E family protein n=1 Tax=Metabacillus kandeliae TaxID=2900151 RepID=UPI001E560473|nr:aspartyl-phosphate phosphatase Spo0E family protein [Metabacillus kandeliae]MCD7034903.1 aspartyl-phosphate phosphatase Spo0E family protein [Metabacillus kandeliae]